MYFNIQRKKYIFNYYFIMQEYKYFFDYNGKIFFQIQTGNVRKMQVLARKMKYQSAKSALQFMKEISLK